MPRDYYEVLGLSKDASPKEIKKAYHKLAVKHHPDHNQTDVSAEEKFKEVAEAYDALSNEEKRAEYDACGHLGNGGDFSRGHHPFSGRRSPFGADIFEQFFGRRHRQQPHPPGQDIVATMRISFLEAAHGTAEDVTIERNVACDPCAGIGGTGRKACPQCRGTGYIVLKQGMMVIQTTCNACAGSAETLKSQCSHCHGAGGVSRANNVNIQIPPGVSSGNQLRVTGMGHYGRGGVGNLYINIEVEEHPEFIRRGKDVHSTLGLTVSEAALGCDKVIETVHGRKSIKVAAGSQAGSVLRLAGFGLTDLNNTPRGDHKLDLQVIIPTLLTVQQRELFEKLAEGEKE